MATESYNGWENHETWALMLHVNNDQWLQEQAVEVVVNAFNEELALVTEGEENPTEDRQGAIYATRDPFKEWVESILTIDGYADSFGGDMSEDMHRIAEEIGSLWRVNWGECVIALLEDRLTEFDSEVKESHEASL